MFDLNDYMKNNRGTNGTPWLVKRITCKDGFEFSAQASHFAYCSPRRDHEDTDAYTRVEVGFPSDKPEFIMEFAEQPEIPTGTVYGYVPVELVEKLVDLHGGLKDSA